MNDHDAFLYDVHDRRVKRTRKIGGYDYDLASQQTMILAFVELPRLIERGVNYRLDQIKTRHNQYNAGY